MLFICHSLQCPSPIKVFRFSHPLYYHIFVLDIVAFLSSVLSRPCPRYSFAEQILLSRPCPREDKKEKKESTDDEDENEDENELCD